MGKGVRIREYVVRHGASGDRDGGETLDGTTSARCVRGMVRAIWLASLLWPGGRGAPREGGRAASMPGVGQKFLLERAEDVIGVRLSPLTRA